MTNRAPVLVTGLGAVTPHGVGVGALWDGVLRADSVGVVADGGDEAARAADVGDAGVGDDDVGGDDVGVGDVGGDDVGMGDAGGLGTAAGDEAARDHGGVVAPVTDLDTAALLPRKLVAQTDRAVQFALVAAAEALRDAGLVDDDGVVRDVDPARVGVVVGTGVGAVTSIVDEQRRADAGRRARPYLAVTLPVNMAAGRVAQRHGLTGPALVVASACAAGTDAIGLAADLIRSGRVDVVVAGGAEAPIAPLTVAAFRAAGALSTRIDEPRRASRPFAADRDGFVLGEGAGVVVLESDASADARGAPGRGTVLGHGATNDAHHPTRPEPTGDRAVAAIRAALADAGLTAEAVGHVNAHATSTPHNDVVEAHVLRRALGPQIGEVPVTATKSTIGHLFGAAGAVEAIVALRSLATGTVPPIANLVGVDPGCADLDLVSGAPRRDSAGAVALSTSFGFGGHNAALLLGAP